MSELKKYRVQVGSPNVKLNMSELTERARKLGMSEALIEELNDIELNEMVILRELSQKEDD